MALEADSEENKNFALKKVRCRPDRSNGFHAGIISCQLDLQPHALFACVREQVIADFKARLAGIQIHASDIRKKIELGFRVRLQQRTGFANEGSVYVDGKLVTVELRALNCAALYGCKPCHGGPVF